MEFKPKCQYNIHYVFVWSILSVSSNKFFQDWFISISVKIFFFLLILTVKDFFLCIILVNKWTGTFNQLCHFQLWNSWDASGKGNCIRLYTTGILNREKSLHALQFCSWISPAQWGKCKILCPVLPFQILRFLHFLQKNFKDITMAEIPLITFHCALTDILSRR